MGMPVPAFAYMFTKITLSPTASPRLTRILGPEKNRVRRNRAVGGLWDYTMQK